MKCRMFYLNNTVFNTLFLGDFFVFKAAVKLDETIAVLLCLNQSFWMVSSQWQKVLK